MSFQATKNNGGILNAYWDVKERSQSDMATYYLIPTIQHSEKGNIMETVERAEVARGYRGIRHSAGGI